MEQREKVVLAGANLNNDVNFTNSMKELEKLAGACDLEVVGTLYQHLDRIQSYAYFGKGKVEELSEYRKEQEADTVVFNDELSPSQIRNLEEALNCKVIDRTVLILDIFSSRARTKEAQLQVEVARLKYMLPRLSGLRESLGRQGGGAGLRNKGAGETKLELDRRKIEDRISRLESELAELALRRQNQRKRRQKQEIPVAALVGYTNAGKSTIMNALMEYTNSEEDKQVFAKDMLFATLETSVRNISFPDNKSFLLTDTVGFISKLPHHLVKAFRSTLEEVSEADLLLHVIDYSDPDYELHKTVTHETLKELGADTIPVLYVYNKTDKAGIDTESVKKAEEEASSIYISAKSKEGVKALVERIKSLIFADYMEYQLLIPYDKGGIVSYLNEKATVLETKYEENGIWLSIEGNRADYEKYRMYEKK
nr:GTPase HflX [Anaerocolumna cellulosilytica]